MVKQIKYIIIILLVNFSFTNQVMSASSIVTVESYNHQILFKPAKIVIFPLSAEIKAALVNMDEKFAQLPSPAGLAAPQIGLPWRIILFQVSQGALELRKDAEKIVPTTLLINPSYQPIDEQAKNEDWERCYSVPGMVGKVSRYKTISYQGFDSNGNKVTGIARGFLARVIQHEIDHVNGKLFYQLIKRKSDYGTVESMQKLIDSEKEKS